MYPIQHGSFFSNADGFEQSVLRPRPPPFRGVSTLLIPKVSWTEPDTQKDAVQIKMNVGRPVFLILGKFRTDLKGDLYGSYRFCTDHIAGNTVFYPACLKPEQGCMDPVGTAEIPGIVIQSDQMVPCCKTAGGMNLVSRILPYRNGYAVGLKMRWIA